MVSCVCRLHKAQDRSWGARASPWDSPAALAERLIPTVAPGEPWSVTVLTPLLD